MTYNKQQKQTSHKEQTQISHYKQHIQISYKQQTQLTHYRKQTQKYIIINKNKHKYLIETNSNLLL
jgi:hypothetical protein